MMKFFILAGGYGKRARPLSLIRPKPAFPVDKTPLINLILKDMKNFGLKSGYINLHYLPEILKQNIKTELNIEYIYEKELSGSAILKTAGNSQDDYTLVVNGDVYVDIPIQPMFESLKTSNADGILLVKTNNDSYSNLDIEDEKYRGISKNKNGKMYCGVAIFKTKLLKYFNEISFFKTIGKKKFDIRVFEHRGIWLDFGNPKLYFKSVFEYMKNRGINNSNSICEDVYISKDSTVSNSILWNKVRIEGKSKIINSIILDGVSVRNMKISDKIVYIKNNELTITDIYTILRL